jgi:hypothetical protein
MERARHRAARLVLGLLLLGALAPGIAAPAAAQIDFGVRAGAYLEGPDPFVGLELLTGLGSSSWFFNPNVEFVFAEDDDLISFNFDFHYDFDTAGNHYVWAGGGPAILLADTPSGDDESDFGANLLGGIGWRYSGMTPYAQLKIVLADDSEVVAGVGVRF